MSQLFSKHLFCIFILYSSLCAAADTTLTWNKQGAMQAERYVAVDSGYDGYKGITPEQLGVPDVYDFLNAAYSGDIAEVQASPDTCKWVSASNASGDVVGYASFEYDSSAKEVYIRQLAIAKEYKRQGIATKLIKEGIAQYPAAKKVVIITRKVNTPAIKMWEKLGFKQSAYMHDGYDANKYIGFEKNL